MVDITAYGGDHPRTVLTFGNRSGQIDSAPFWASRDQLIAGITKGTLVQVVATVASFRDRSQLEVTSIRPLPKGEVPLSELVPSVGSVERYWDYLDRLRAEFTASRLAAIAALFFDDDAFRERFEQCPAAPGTGHHARLGGLLQHTCEVISIARTIAQVARADSELVTVGAMLHDVGKTEAYSWETGVFETTEWGRLAGHVVIGALMFRRRLDATPEICTEDEARLVEHMILSHHNKLEFGSPVRPLTLEAELLSFADDASAKTAAINESYASNEFFADENARVSSRRIWQLDNRWLLRIRPDFGRDKATGGNERAADQVD